MMPSPSSDLEPLQRPGKLLWTVSGHWLSQSLPPAPAGSPAGGHVLPGHRPRADPGGEGQHSQEGEEAQVEQAFDAVVADASEGVQVVLEGERDPLGRSGAQPGA